MQSVLKQLIPLAEAHRKADEYQVGHYWQGNGAGTGCAVGCTIHDAIKLGVLPNGTQHDSHHSIAEATGLPEMLWRLADHIFEGLSVDDRPNWTPRFLRAASKCKNSANVPARIMARLAERLAKDAIRVDVTEACIKTAALWRRRANGDEPNEGEWQAAWEQADVARKQAYAARKQAYAAREQADIAWKQADIAWEQASAAWEQWWSWCAGVVCEELTAK